jgi:hypothetical protein
LKYRGLFLFSRNQHLPFNSFWHAGTAQHNYAKTAIIKSDRSQCLLLTESSGLAR